VATEAIRTQANRILVVEDEVMIRCCSRTLLANSGLRPSPRVCEHRRVVERRRTPTSTLPSSTPISTSSPLACSRCLNSPRHAVSSLPRTMTSCPCPIRDRPECSKKAVRRSTASGDAAEHAGYPVVSSSSLRCGTTGEGEGALPPLHPLLAPKASSRGRTPLAPNWRR